MQQKGLPFWILCPSAGIFQINIEKNVLGSTFGNSLLINSSTCILLANPTLLRVASRKRDGGVRYLLTVGSITKVKQHIKTSFSWHNQYRMNDSIANLGRSTAKLRNW
jgi:hypothetical protein